MKKHKHYKFNWEFLKEELIKMHHMYYVRCANFPYSEIPRAYKNIIDLMTLIEKNK